MAYSISRLTVRDFEAWMPFMEGFAEMREAAGSRGSQVFQSEDDKNEVVVILEWSDLEAARSFLKSPALIAVMQKAGVIEASEALFAETVHKLDA